MKKQNLELRQIDFTKSWLEILLQNKYIFIIIATGEACLSIFNTLLPTALGSALTFERLDFLLFLCACWISQYIIQYWLRKMNASLQLVMIHSVHASAHSWFLQADPMYHSRRSSGAILGKIDRAARAYEGLIDAVTFELISILIGCTTVTLSALLYNKTVGLLLALFLIILGALIITISLKIIRPMEKEWVKADDKARAISVENLSQTALIRSTFASNEINNKLLAADKNSIEKESALWFTYIKTYVILRIMYIASISLLAVFLFYEIKAGHIAPALAIGFIITYMNGTREILKLDKPMREIMKSITRIKDLASYMSHFGKQSYPVLSDRPCDLIPLEHTQENKIEIEAKNLFFDYHARAKIFDNHTFQLTVPIDLSIKLYGLIGPSGIGKSTFISLLGGQLRPTAGSVTIAGINIYEVDDNTRRRLIALQGQVATTFRGTVAYNLLFGLPEKVALYTDDYLITLLKDVGLWSFFEIKDGLETFIGEGGLSLSGGQRQRLNFANLYIRAHYFKPALILIDEPTSSLDEVSEQAITNMIVELSRHSITLVIAHRLKTVSQAVGLLDFSLLPHNKEMRFYTHSDLLIESSYYRQLITGQAQEL